MLVDMISVLGVSWPLARRWLMRRRGLIWSAWLVLLVACIGLGCQEVKTPPQVLRITVSEGTVDWVVGPREDRVPLAGATLCQADTQNCAISDANGIAEIEVPPNERIMWTLEKEGYAPTLVPDVTDNDFDSEGYWPLFTDEYMENFCEQVGCRWPLTSSGLGLVVVFAQPNVEGVAFRLVGATEDRIYYYDDEGHPRLDLTETSRDGRGGFIGVPPGEHEVEFTVSGQFCTPTWAWPGTESNRIEVPVREGFIITPGIYCTAQALP